MFILLNTGYRSVAFLLYTSTGEAKIASLNQNRTEEIQHTVRSMKNLI